jgi:arylsulfatase A-like enzyme
MKRTLHLFAGLLAPFGLVLAAPRPNIILAMADDMGWGDPGYNSIRVAYADGTPHPDQGWIRTPTMDTMAANGLRFDRFYAASAVCSPTRASCLTGRNPFRVGVPYANEGRLGFGETPLSKVLAAQGYRCGHFGKWHLGTLTTLRSDANRGGDASVYSAPWHHAYESCFATESKVPTYHPYRKPANGLALPTGFSDANFYGTRYWRMPATWNQTSGEGIAVPVGEINNAADGDSSRLLSRQVIPFIQNAVADGRPFFVVLWFHTPHKPIVDPAGVAAVDSSASLKASIEDMDAALGMVRDELTALGVRGNTMFWMTSDNGPEDGVNSPNETSTVRSLSIGALS